MSDNQKATDTNWASTPERSNMLMLRIMTWVSLHLGRRVSRIVLHFIASYFLLFSPTSRNASRDYLKRALGHAPRWYDLYQHFFTFASTIHDRLYLVNRRFDLFDFEVHGAEMLHKLLDEGSGLFLMGAHLGSFEVIHSLAVKRTDLRVAMLMYEENARKINATLNAINPQITHDIIGLGHIDSMIQVSERLDEGYMVGILADRSPDNNDAHYSVDILGSHVNLPSGPLRMAALLKRPVVFMTGLYLGGNRYAIHFDTLADFSNITRSERADALQTASLRYAKLINHYCHKAPYNWFNFFDFWKSTSTKGSSKS
tara:strand:+ start:57223 stop:58164 length:942 start_codon:yes stop_codon:yes gene_type:complete